MAMEICNFLNLSSRIVCNVMNILFNCRIQSCNKAPVTMGRHYGAQEGTGQYCGLFVHVVERFLRTYCRISKFLFYL
jgi:hypothetical protein